MNRLLSITTFLPLAGATVLLIGGKAVRDETTRVVALITSVVAFLVSLAVYGKFDNAAPGLQLLEQATWSGRLGCSTWWASTA